VTKRYNDDGPPALDDIELDIAPANRWRWSALRRRQDDARQLIPRFYAPTAGRVRLDVRTCRRCGSRTCAGRSRW